MIITITTLFGFVFEENSGRKGKCNIIIFFLMFSVYTKMQSQNSLKPTWPPPSSNSILRFVPAEKIKVNVH